ncbi:unnamed protein product [Coffea canephora]|uniref:Subtilisin-like protease fibronectin type-III domain-containing protein n=1 Tax=Coffea canephora TaxID=49390 RepID=A0A068V313_COFCA|nr:unnamed protein product [Coffea canephora]
MNHGILTSASAGNWGNGTTGLLNNYSPWALTFAAATIDRKFVTKVHLGDKEVYVGVSINAFDLNGTLYPLVYSVDGLAIGHDGNESRYYMIGSLNDTNQVTGKIVFTDHLNSWMRATDVGAIGIVMHAKGPLDYGDTYSLPASLLYNRDGNQILSCINSTSDPTTTIDKSIEIIDKAASSIVSFSSRGPNPITVDILKPDLSAPGVEILAAWSEATTVMGYVGDKRSSSYVKSFNPTWSPSAIKSALMTTDFLKSFHQSYFLILNMIKKHKDISSYSKIISAEKDIDAEFAYGSGQINPLKAVTPSLVYDIEEKDFVSFLCRQTYNITSLRLITGDSIISCSKDNNSSVWDLNYPSFTLSAPSGHVARVFHRTVTNVANVGSTYKATIIAPPQLSVQVNSTILTFESTGQKQSFTMKVKAHIAKNITSGSLVRDDGVHQVRSPVVAHSFESRRKDDYTGSFLKGGFSYKGFHPSS